MDAAAPTPIATGLSGQIQAALIEEEKSIASLADQVAKSTLPDADRRKLWNSNYTAITDKAADKIKVLLVDALKDEKNFTATWLDVKKAYTR
jgi:hypothetical protein